MEKLKVLQVQGRIEKAHKVQNALQFRDWQSILFLFAAFPFSIQIGREKTLNSIYNDKNNKLKSYLFAYHFRSFPCPFNLSCHHEINHLRGATSKDHPTYSLKTIHGKNFVQAKALNPRGPSMSEKPLNGILHLM